jgi:very-short-patch-repair endonuclease
VGSVRRNSSDEGGPPPLLALAALADRQWGVVALAQVLDLGITRHALYHSLSVGRLHRLHRGVYAVGHRQIGDEGRTLAAVMACGRGAVLSHQSAAAWWGLSSRAPRIVHVTAPRGRRGRDGVTVHRSRQLDAGVVTRRRGIPITTVERTLLDIAATAAADDLADALATARRLGRLHRRRLEDVIARCSGHPGSGALTRAIAARPAPTRNAFERGFLQLVRRAGLPDPLVNSRVAAPDHPFLEVDFLWPSHALIVETDGYETHGTRRAFEADRAKDAALTAAGFRVVRFTWRTDQAIIVRRLRALLA